MKMLSFVIWTSRGLQLLFTDHVFNTWHCNVLGIKSLVIWNTEFCFSPLPFRRKEGGQVGYDLLLLFPDRMPNLKCCEVFMRRWQFHCRLTLTCGWTWWFILMRKACCLTWVLKMRGQYRTKKLIKCLSNKSSRFCHVAAIVTIMLIWSHCCHKMNLIRQKL